MDRDQETFPKSVPRWIPQLCHNISGIIESANPAFVELLGYTTPDFENAHHPSLSALTPSEERDTDQSHLDQAQATREPVFWQKSFVQRDGTRIRVIFGTRLEPDNTFRSIALPVTEPEPREDLLVANLIQRYDEEKRGLARKLHDATSQNLAALAINLSILPTLPPASADVNQLLAECNTLITDSLAEIRGISYRLHPPLLEELGLFPALRAYAQVYTRNTGIEISLDIPNHCARPTPAIEAVLFRIVQERLTYLENFGDATECSIQWECPEQSPTLIISDNSDTAPDLAGTSGFDQHLSFAVLRNRAQTIGANLIVESRSRSTTIRAIITRS